MREKELFEIGKFAPKLEVEIEDGSDSEEVALDEIDPIISDSDPNLSGLQEELEKHGIKGDSTSSENLKNSNS